MLGCVTKSQLRYEGKEEHELKLNVKLPAANFLMLIYGHIHYKHQARPARACSPGTRWKELLVQTQIFHTRRLEAALMLKCRVWLATAKVAPRLLLSNHKVISALPGQTIVPVFPPK